MKKLILIFGLLTLAAKAQACLDCSNTGTDAVFTGSVTAGGFIGPTINELYASTASLDSRLGGFGLSTQTLANQTLVGLDETVPLTGGDLRAVNCSGTGITCTQSASTLTVTVAGGSNAQKIYQVTVCSAAAVTGSCNILSDDQNGIFQALAMIGAMGLVNASSAPGTIFYGAGTFSVLNATIPKGVTLTAVAGASTTFLNTSSVDSSLYIYGRVENIVFNFNANSARRGRAVYVRSGGELVNFKGYGMENMPLSGGAPVDCLFCLYQTSAAYVQGELINPTYVQGDAQGTLPFLVYQSSFNTTSVKVTGGSCGNVARGVLFIASSTYNTFLSWDFPRAQCSAITLNALASFNTFDGIKMFIQGAGCSTVGCLTLSASDAGNYAVGAGSGNVIMNSVFTVATAVGDTIIGINNTTNIFHNTTLKNNRAYSIGSGTPVFYSDGGGTKSLLTGNNVFGTITFISDSGIGTQYTGATYGNFKNNVLQ